MRATNVLQSSRFSCQPARRCSSAARVRVGTCLIWLCRTKLAGPVGPGRAPVSPLIANMCCCRCLCYCCGLFAVRSPIPSPLDSKAFDLRLSKRVPSSRDAFTKGASSHPSIGVSVCNRTFSILAVISAAQAPFAHSLPKHAPPELSHHLAVAAAQPEPDARKDP